MNTHTTFDLPDLLVASALTSFEFSPAARDGAAGLLAAGPAATLQQLVRDQESETTLLAARRILGAFLQDAGATAGGEGADDADAGGIASRVGAVRDELAATIDSLTGAGSDVREAVVRQRAPLALLAGCWLDTLSQPATQPSVVVNRLYAQHFRLRGEGNPQRALHHARRRALEDAGTYLPGIESNDFLAKADARPLTALHAAFYVALSRLPASFLPEVVGVHYAFFALGVDDLLTGAGPALAEADLRAVLEEYLSLTRQSGDGLGVRRRLQAAVRLVLALEREHVAMLAELAGWRSGLSLDAQVAAIIDRHRRFAGRQHGKVRIGGRLLTEAFGEDDLDLAAFVRDFRESAYVRPLRGGDCRFLRALKFGGPMFGIFDEREAATLRAWVEAAQAGELGAVEIPHNRVGDDAAATRMAAVEGCEPADVTFAVAEPRDDRELFYRLVNIEHFPNTLPLARERAARGFADAEVLFAHGARGTYTDASWFDYSPEALFGRVEAIYWDKCVDPYEPLDEVPDRDAVLFGQKAVALASLIDGAWAHRIGNLGRFDRPSDAMLFAIYADEMGRGDLVKNHVTIIHQVLQSMSIHLPHIRDAAFVEQDELPDSSYGFSIHQMCMCLFPDTYYNEILGYNLAVEMFGLGELRLHEIQKLAHHGFDTSYEQIHLSIDNVSAGHARQSADLIVAYLDGVERSLGRAVVQDEWRRIWRGYASFAYFVERPLLESLRSGETPAEPDTADLLI